MADINDRCRSPHTRWPSPASPALATHAHYKWVMNDLPFCSLDVVFPNKGVCSVRWQMQSNRCIADDLVVQRPIETSATNWSCSLVKSVVKHRHGKRLRRTTCMLICVLWPLSSVAATSTWTSVCAWNQLSETWKQPETLPQPTASVLVNTSRNNSTRVHPAQNKYFNPVLNFPGSYTVTSVGSIAHLTTDILYSSPFDTRTCHCASVLSHKHIFAV
jgi:hypothetical protein